MKEQEVVDGVPNVPALIKARIFEGWLVHSFYVDPTGRANFIVFEREKHESVLSNEGERKNVERRKSTR